MEATYPVALAEYDFESEHEGDLPFDEGDEIVVFRKLSDLWWRGRHEDGREGLFPANYISITGNVDHDVAEEEARAWASEIAKAKALRLERANLRTRAEKELATQRSNMEKANSEAAEKRAEELKLQQAMRLAESKKEGDKLKKVCLVFY